MLSLLKIVYVGTAINAANSPPLQAEVIASRKSTFSIIIGSVQVEV